MKTHSQPLEPVAQSALLAVYELASQERLAHLGNVASHMGVSRAEAARALALLDDLGLLWAERCRLSMRGLALAVRVWSQRARARRSSAA